MNLLEKYIILVDEYKDLTDRNVIPKRRNKLKYFSYQELVLKITLLRKFMMNSEEMFIKNVLKELKTKAMNHDIENIKNIESKIDKLYKLEISYSLPNSKLQNLYHSVHDLLYGLYLHSDTEKIENSILSDEKLRKHLLLNFIQEFDPIIFETYRIVSKYVEVKVPDNSIKEKSAVLHLTEKSKVKRNVQKSPRWSNIDGKDIDQNEINQFVDDLSNRDKRILDTADLFINLLQEDKVDKDKISKLLTPQSPIYSNIEKNAEIFKTIDNVALSTIVRYSTNLKYAYVYFFEDVEHAFSLDNPQILNNVNCIRFKKNAITNNYKINNFVNELPHYYMTTTQNRIK